MHAPWTPEQCDTLNAQQQAGEFHPYTCGNRKDIEKTHADGEGILVATPDGWVCPWCDYRQDWAHEPPHEHDLHGWENEGGAVTE